MRPTSGPSAWSAGAIFRWLAVLLFAFQAQHTSRGQEESQGSIRGSNQELETNHESNKQQEGGWALWWSYDGISGPDYWNINKQWQICSVGRKQSPVDVRTDSLVYDHLLAPLRLAWQPAAGEPQARGGQEQGTGRPVQMRLLNSGRGLEAWLEPGPNEGPRGPTEPPIHRLLLSEGPLSYSYQLFKIELHVGTGAASSEHLIDGRPFVAELQLHFYNRQLASSAAEALGLAERHPRASLFASVAVFLLATNLTSGSELAQGSQLDFLLEGARRVRQPGDSIRLELPQGKLEGLLTSRSQYVTYQGSMSRPPCAETVDWILPNKPLRIPEQQLTRLRELLASAGAQDNVRPVRPLHRRQLRTSIRMAGRTGSASSADQELQLRALAGGEPCAGPNLGSCGSAPPSGQRPSAGKPDELGGCPMRPSFVYQLSAHLTGSRQPAAGKGEL